MIDRTGERSIDDSDIVSCVELSLFSSWTDVEKGLTWILWRGFPPVHGCWNTAAAKLMVGQIEIEAAKMGH